MYPLIRSVRHGLDCYDIPVKADVLVGGPMRIELLLDSGCRITTVSEDVAARLGLPAGGRPVTSRGIGGAAAGRLVPVRFRFVFSAGVFGPATDTHWVVVPPGRRSLRLLALRDVLPHFEVRTLNADVYFVRK